MAAVCTLAVLFVFVAAGSAYAEAPTSLSSVVLSGFSCPTQIPGCAAKRCTSRVLKGEETHVCLRCQSGYMPVRDGRSIVQCAPTASKSAKLSGFSCPAQIPGCAANRCTIRLVNNQETPVCLRCSSGYVPVKDGKSTVQCVAAPKKTVQALSGPTCAAQIPNCAAKRCTMRLINNQETPVCLRCQSGFVAVKEGKSTVQCVPAASSSSSKALSSVSCPAQIPGCAANRCTTRMINNQQTPVCLRCQSGYVAVKEGKSTVQCVSAASSSSSKALSGVSCPAQIPGCAANRCTTRMINNQQTPVCLRCQSGYVAVKEGKSTVQCVPAASSSSSKALSGVSCPVQIPGCAANRCTTRSVNGQQAPVCLRCEPGFVAVKDGRSVVQCVAPMASSNGSSTTDAHASQQQQLYVQQHRHRGFVSLVLGAFASL